MSFLDGIKEAIGAAPVKTEEEAFNAQNTDAQNTDAQNAPNDTQSAPADTKADAAPKADDTAKSANADGQSSTGDAELDLMLDHLDGDQSAAQPSNPPASQSDNDLSDRIIDETITASQKPVNPIHEPKKEARNKMMPLDFYDKKTAATYIFNYDNGAEMNPRLREWVLGAIEDDKVLSEDVVLRILPQILVKNPELITELKRVITEVSDKKFIPYKLFLVNIKDKTDKTEYTSVKEAKEQSELIRNIIDVYGQDPKTIFQPVYREVDAEGNLGEHVDLNVVQAYVNNFDGNKDALRTKLHLPKPQPQGKPQSDNSQPQKGKKGNKPNKKGDKNSNPSNAVNGAN